MKRNKMWFMAEDDGGGGSFEPDLTASSEGSANDSPEGTVDVTPEVKPAFDPATFAKEFGSTFAETFAKAQPKTEEAKPKLSPEEAKKLLNVWEPSDDFVTKFGNLETQKAAIAEMRDGIVKQMDTIAQMRLQQQREELESRYAPMVSGYQQQQQEAQQNRFDKAYPQLADPKVKQVLTAAAQSILAEKKQFANESDMFKEIASRTEAIIKQFDSNFKLSTTQSASGSKAGRTIPVTTTGANGGGGRGGDRSNTKIRAIDLLPGPTG